MFTDLRLTDGGTALSSPSVGAQGETAAEAEGALLNTYDSAIKTSSDPLLPDDRQTDGSDAKRRHQVATQPPGVSPTPSPDRHRASTAFDAADDPSRASQSPGGVDGDCCSESGEPGNSEHPPAAVAVAFSRSFVNGASDGDQEGAADLRAMSSGPGSARGLPGAVPERRQQHGAAVGEATAIAAGDESDGGVGGGCGGERRRSVAAVCPEHASSSSSSALGDETVVVVAEGRAAEKETGGDDNVAPNGDPTTGGGDSPVVSAPAVDGHGGLHLAGPRRRKGERAAGAELKQRKPDNESLAQGDVPLEVDESSAGGISGADADEFHPSIGIVPSDSSDVTGSKRTASSGCAGDGYRTAVDEDGCSSGDEGSLDAAEEWNIVPRPVTAGDASSVESGRCSDGASGRGLPPRNISVGGHDDEDDDDDVVDVGRRPGGRVARGGSARRRKVLVESSESGSSTPGSEGARGEERGFAPRGPVVVSSEAHDGETCSGGDAGRGVTAAAAGTMPSRRPRRQGRRVIDDDDEESSDDSTQEEVVRSVSSTGRKNADIGGFSYVVESSFEDEEEEEEEEEEEDVSEHQRPTAGIAQKEKPTAAAASSAPSEGESSDDAGEAIRSRRRPRAAARGKRSASAVQVADSSSSPASSRTAAGGVSPRGDKITSTRDDGHDIDDDDDDEWSIGPSTRRPNLDRRRKVQEGPSSDKDSPRPSPAAETPAKSSRPAKPRRAEPAEDRRGGGPAEGKSGGTVRKKGRAQGGGVDSAAGGLTGAAFSRARDSLTAKYFAEFNEGAFGGALSDVKVAWSARLSTTAGVTKSLRRVNPSGEDYAYLSTVELSTKVLDSEDKLQQQTLLHELCHAAAWVVDHKSNPPHGEHFWAWANRAKAAHPGVPITTCHSYAINYKYRYTCVGASLAGGGGSGCDDEAGLSGGRGCGAVIGRHSKSIDVARQVCGRCKGRLVLFGTHGTDGKLKKPRAATGFSLFVKERYAEVKGALPPGTKQQQVMKEMSRQWAARGNVGSAAGGGDRPSSAGADRIGKANAKAKAAGDRGSGAGAVPLLDKENASFVDLT
ncbi:conserved unknown protein [Ectocarpus siliculosus]|uniref:SprT-like domain-containing protein n=1 Tax=Ectocarpus siliculosus TaxID=2880 RepID=D7G0U3_ECTSI|nr:conserved unknown protein [Ectocarpus siliculosus]|eukprot:CBJ26687.1 conserved unknown protein [Ectocarpus siliculosus]